MAIYLDDLDRKYIENLLKKQTDFIGKRLLGKVLADNERLEKIGQCQHEAGTFVGKKTCCTKCESYFEPGMGFSWSLEHTDWGGTARVGSQISSQTLCRCASDSISEVDTPHEDKNS